jgi:plasmid stability protein
MATLTVRSVPSEVYDDLKELAARHDRSMEAEARDIVEAGVRRRRRWLGATLADLSGPAELAALEVPYVRSPDLPRDVEP